MRASLDYFYYITDDGIEDFYWYKPDGMNSYFIHVSESENVTKILNQYL